MIQDYVFTKLEDLLEYTNLIKEETSELINEGKYEEALSTYNTAFNYIEVSVELLIRELK